MHRRSGEIAAGFLKERELLQVATVDVMKTAMRCKLAEEPFEQKIRKLGRLLQLSATLKAQRSAMRHDSLIISAIRSRSVLEFSYNGKLRLVEPQTYGLSTMRREVLRAHERLATNGVKHFGTAKLFDLAKISGLKETGLKFSRALPSHNPDDSAMIEIFATLPRPAPAQSL